MLTLASRQLRLWAVGLLWVAALVFGLWALGWAPGRSDKPCAALPDAGYWGMSATGLYGVPLVEDEVVRGRADNLRWRVVLDTADFQRRLCAAFPLPSDTHAPLPPDGHTSVTVPPAMGLNMPPIPAAPPSSEEPSP